MVTRSKPATEESRRLSLESLKRAQMAFAALDSQESIPDVAKEKAVKPIKEPIKPKNSAAKASAMVAPTLPGLVTSQEGRPNFVDQRDRVKVNGIGLKITATGGSGSAFERLKMGQNRLGTSTIDPAKKPVDIKALDQKVFNEIKNESKLKHVISIFDAIAKYYRFNEIHKENELNRLKGMDTSALNDITVAYEFIHNNVMILTNDEYAQKAAREVTTELKKFYDDNGTTEMQIKSEEKVIVDPKRKYKRQ